MSFPKTGWSWLDGFTKYTGLRKPETTEAIWDFMVDGYNTASQKLANCIKTNAAITNDPMFAQFSAEKEKVDNFKTKNAQLIKRFNTFRKQALPKGNDLNVLDNYLNTWSSFSDELFNLDAYWFSLRIKSKYAPFTAAAKTYFDKVMKVLRGKEKGDKKELIETLQQLLTDCNNVITKEEEKIANNPYPSTCMKLLHAKIFRDQIYHIIFRLITARVN